MALNFSMYSVSFLLLFFIVLFIIFSDKIINVFISLICFSFMIFFILQSLTYEYLALTYFIIYFGAILMLFLFIIMLLDIENENIYYNTEYDRGLIFLFYVVLKFLLWFKSFFYIYPQNYVIEKIITLFLIPEYSIFSTIELFIVFFNFYWIWLFFIGWILFIIMVGFVNALIDTNIEIIKFYRNEN